MSPEFDDVVDATGLEPDELRRLRKVHELLVQAGPPADLPEALSRPPRETAVHDPGGRVIPFPSRSRRAAFATLVAAAVAAACFGGGYLLANQTRHSTIQAVRVVPMTGEQSSFASLRVGSADSEGNWPLELTATGLPKLGGDAYYVLMVWRNGKPVAFCGTFEVASAGATTLRFSVPYRVTRNTKWVVTRFAPGTTFPGHVVMTTA